MIIAVWVGVVIGGQVLDDMAFDIMTKKIKKGEKLSLIDRLTILMSPHWMFRVLRSK